MLATFSNPKRKNFPHASDETSVEEFWPENSHIFRVIFEIYKLYLAAPAESTPSERLFSAGKNQVWNRRNTIGPDTIDEVVFSLFLLNK